MTNGTTQHGSPKGDVDAGSAASASSVKEKAMSFDALDESLAQLEAKLSALQGRRPAAPAPRQAAPAAPAATRDTVDAPALAMPAAEPRAPRPAAAPAAPAKASWKALMDEVAAPPRTSARPAAAEPVAPRAAETLGSGAVVREIGRIRSDMTGEIGRRFEDLGREIAGLRKSVASDRSADMIQAEFGRVYDGLEAVATALDQRAGDREAKRELDALRHAVERLAQEDTLHAVGRGQDELARRLAKHQAAVDPEIASIRGQLDEIVKRIESSREPAMLEGIERRIHALGAAIEDVRAIAGEGPDLRALEARLEDVARVVVAASQARPEMDTAPFERIEARVAAHQRRVDEREKRRDQVEAEMIGHLDGRLDALVRAQNASAGATDELATGLSARFDALQDAVHGSHERTATQVATDMTPRFDQVAGHVEAVKGRIEDWGDRLEGWGKRLEAEIGRPRDPEINMFKALASRLDAVSDRLAEMPDAGTDDQNWAALEARLTAVLHKLDAIPTDTAAGAGLDDVRSALGTIAWKLEQPAETPEGVSAVASRLDTLSERIEAVAADAKLGDDTIARIGETVSSSIAGTMETQLSTRLGELTEVLHRTTAPLADLGQRIDALEETMGDTQATLVDTARTAAEDVVRTMMESRDELAPGQIEAVTALDGDLKRLESLTVTNDERNSKTFDAVHETLLKIVDRLDQLDRMVAKAAEGPDPAVVAATQAALVQSAQGANPSLMDRLRGRAQHDEAVPAVAPAAAPAAPAIDDAAFAGLDADQPLEPGTGEPRLDPAGIDAMTGQAFGAADEPTVEGIVERVRAGEGKVDPADDFMAVARRKAKALSDEAEFTGALSEEDTKKGKKGKKAKAEKDGASKSRRPLLIAAAATIVALLALPQIISTVTGVVSPSAPPAPIADAGPAITADEPIETVEADTMGAEGFGDVVETEDPVFGAEEDFGEEVALNETADTIETQAIGDEPVMVDEPSPAEEAVAVAADTFTPIDGPVAGAAFTAADGPAPLVAAATAGDPRALFEIAGRNSATDQARAFELYLAASERGLAPAMYRLGQAYEKGRGTTLDYDKARRWYARAADAGNTSAMHNLAVLNAMSADGSGSADEAGRWFTMAAEHGVKDSQYNLGILHAQGNGVTEDLTESYKWFDAAAKAGDGEAGAKRDEVAGAMDPAQLEAARAKAVAFQPKAAPVEANRVTVPAEWRAKALSAADMKKAVRNVQAILNKSGFDAGVADGVMGNKTRTAIKAFQAAEGLPETGEIDDALVKALLRRNG